MLQELSALFHQSLDFIVNAVSDMGYFGIFVLMTIESSFIPFPSEVVIIPAGYLVRQGQMNMPAVFAAAVGGSLCGAYINYYLAYTLGRKFIIKYGRYFLLPEDKFLQVERVFLKHGSFTTLVGRLIFGIRQWISLPAGLARMPLVPFLLYTGLGAFIWVAVLVALGYVLGTGEESKQAAKLVGYWLLGVVVVMGAAYIWWQRVRSKKGECCCSGAPIESEQ